VSERAGGFCTECGHEVEGFEGLDRCPACGSVGVPCAWSQQVNLSVNWHELRVLVIWAENWARHHKRSDPSLSRTVYSIAARLQRQYPGRTPLTLAGELGQLAEEFPGAGTNDARLRQDIAEQTGHEIDLIRKPRKEDDHA
jgi:hypothetical protein